MSGNEFTLLPIALKSSASQNNGVIALFTKWGKRSSAGQHGTYLCFIDPEGRARAVGPFIPAVATAVHCASFFSMRLPQRIFDRLVLFCFWVIICLGNEIFFE